MRLEAIARRRAKCFSWRGGAPPEWSRDAPASSRKNRETYREACGAKNAPQAKGADAVTLLSGQRQRLHKATAPPAILRIPLPSWRSASPGILPWPLAPHDFKQVDVFIADNERRLREKLQSVCLPDGSAIWERAWKHHLAIAVFEAWGLKLC